MPGNDRLAPCGHVWEGQGGTCTQERCVASVTEEREHRRLKLELTQAVDKAQRCAAEAKELQMRAKDAEYQARVAADEVGVWWEKFYRESAHK